MSLGNIMTQECKNFSEIFFNGWVTNVLICRQDISGNNTMLGVGHVATTSVSMCDIDVRPVSSHQCNPAFPCQFLTLQIF